MHRQSLGLPVQEVLPPSGDANRALNEIPLIPCPSSLDTSTNDIKFCCGPDAASCCQNASAWTTIPTGSILGLPASETSSSSTTSSSSLRIGLGIGLGIGIPILLVLLAVAYLLAQPHLRRRRRRRARARAGTAGTASSEKTGSDAAAPRSRHRRDSFGRVNTNGPPSDDGDDWSPHHPHHHHAWPPTLAAWAERSWGAAAAAGDERPQSPREMEARSGSRLRGRLFGLGSGPAAAAAAAELPTEGGSSRVVVEDGAGGRGKVRVAAEEVELPTPDTPRPPAAAAAAAAVAVAGGSEGKRTVGGDMEAGRGGYRPSRGGGGQEAGREGEA
ncbi:32b28d8e-9f71-420c-a062-9f3878478732 [Thermothielavioides terrestris]|uniref:32b28d8e-9f71-420c-a062-9f3878478732 n=1 Tax=Thermothielavioides terrestris TaxID=2587410 RepID=A0A446BPB2_9PEZI|nr:32b28d8e-9f71-420c-a062-9f3878478732 [Thermothielavioides terrestris]